MTSKDYKMVAGVIAKIDGGILVSKFSLASILSRAFEDDNPRFDKHEFHRACFAKAETEPK